MEDQAVARKQSSTRLVVRVDLRGAVPPIWRRLEIDPNLTLDQVNAVIQAAFEWSNSHLHAFSTTPPGRRWGGQRFVLPFLLDDDDEATDEATAQLGTLLVNPGDIVDYLYDFGDSWEHSIKLEKHKNAAPSVPAALCTRGRRAGPPDDCGGIWGYLLMIEAGLDPEHPEYEEYVEQIESIYGEGAIFDPAHFDLDRANQRIAAAVKSQYQWWFIDDTPE